MVSFDPAILNLEIKELSVDLEKHGEKRAAKPIVEGEFVGRTIQAIFYNPIYSITYLPNDEIFVRGILEEVRTVDSKIRYQIAIRYHDVGQNQVKLLSGPEFAFWK